MYNDSPPPFQIHQCHRDRAIENYSKVPTDQVLDEIDLVLMRRLLVPLGLVDINICSHVINHTTQIKQLIPHLTFIFNANQYPICMKTPLSFVDV